MIHSSSWGSVTPARPPCREDLSFVPTGVAPLSIWLGEGIPKSRGADCAPTEVRLWRDTGRKEWAEKEKQGERGVTFFPLVPSSSASLSSAVSAGLFPTVVFSELPHNTHLLPVVSRHCKQEPPPRGAQSGPGSGLFLPSQTAVLHFCSSSSAWFSVPVTCSSGWKASSPLVGTPWWTRPGCPIGT